MTSGDFASVGCRLGTACAAIGTLDKDDERVYRTLVVGDLREAWDLLRHLQVALEMDEYDQRRKKRKRLAA